MDEVETGASRRPAPPARATTAGRRTTRRRPSWLRLPRNRVGAAVVVVVLVAAGLVASLGAGYTVAKPLLGDASTYVAKGDDVAHANAETGSTDAQSPQPVLPGGHTYTPIQLPDGSVVAVDDQTGQVVSVDGTTLEPSNVPVTDPDGNVPTYPAPSDSGAPGDGGSGDGGSGPPPQIVVAGDVTWYVDLANGRVARFTPGGVKDFVGIDGGIAAAQPGPEGLLVVLTRDEAVVQVSPSLDVRRLPVGGTGEGTLTVAAGHVYLVTSTGKVLQVDGRAVQTVGVTGVTGSTPTVPTWRGSGRFLLEVDGGARTLTVVDTVAATTKTFALAGAKGPFGPPAQLGGRAYVPDYGAHRLLVVDLASGTSLDPVDVTGTSSTFDVWVASDRVWANDQSDRRLVAVNPDGDVTVVDKGTGSGVTDSTNPDPPKDPGPTTAPPAGTPPIGAPPANPPASTSPPQPSNPPPSNPVPAAPAAPTTVVVPPVRVGDPYEQVCAAIEAVQLVCSAVPGGSDLDGDSGDSATIDPAPGSSVDAGSTVVVTYVGQLEAPGVTGKTADVACQIIEAQNLVCDRQTDDTVVKPVEVGKVSGQNPSRGTEIDKGGKVTILVPDTFAMADYAGNATDSAQACDGLARFGVTCAPVVQGDPAIDGHVANTVESQDPAAGAPVKAGATVAFTVWSGNSKPTNDYTNRNIDEAVAACNADGQTLGYSCAPQQGDNTTDGSQSNIVYGQNPPAGQSTGAGGQVVLTFHHLVSNVPAVAVGDTVENACAQVQAANLVCVPTPVAGDPTSKNAHPVVSQSPGPGTAEPQSQVVVNYVDVGAAQPLVMGSNAAGDVFVVRLGSPDPDYSYNVTALGFVYAGTVSGGRWLNGFYCTTNGEHACGGGRDVNHFYSALGTPYNNWVGPNPTAFLAPCAAGSAPLYRTWVRSALGDLVYRMDFDISAHGDGSYEQVGCVWT